MATDLDSEEMRPCDMEQNVYVWRVEELEITHKLAPEKSPVDRQKYLPVFELPEPKPANPMKAVSLGWVLNQLAGSRFPEQGQAYDFIKKCSENF